MFDVIVIGGGIAGASIAYELAARHHVLVLEAEEQPGYHATGRSAALFSEIYGGGPVRALSRASRAFFLNPPDGFPRPLLTPRGSLFVAGEATLGQLEALYADADVSKLTRGLDGGEARRLVPILQPEWTRAAVYEPGSYDIDVHGLHQGYLRGLKNRGGELRLSEPVTRLAYDRSRWIVSTRAGSFEAPLVVNAAGAWADEVAELAGVKPAGLSPCRRTAAIIEAPNLPGAEAWPLTIAADESFYFKPDAGRLLVSPADETPVAPCDAQPDEYDVALAAYRFEQATGLEVKRVISRWAGLRTFSKDRIPIIGRDPAVPAFFWLVGQGGYGIQTAPAAAILSAALITEAPVPAELSDHGVCPAELAPDRCIEPA